MYKKVNDKTLIKLYKELKSVWKVADKVGMCGQSVHERLIKLNAINKFKPEFSHKNIELIKETYEKGFKRGDGTLDKLSKKLNKSKPNISRLAKRLGITNKNRNLSKIQREKMSLKRKDWYKMHEHPRGMLGKHHSEKYRKQLSEQTSNWFKNATEKQKAERLKKMLLTKSNNVSFISRGSWKAQWKTIGNKKCFFRSSWEVTYAIYLQFLKEKGKIKDWLYEPEKFTFKNNTSPFVYKPDFKIILNSNNHVWREVKGWMDKRSIKTIERFHEQYSNESLKLIQKKEINALNGVIWKDDSYIVQMGITKLYTEHDNPESRTIILIEVIR